MVGRTDQWSNGNTSCQIYQEFEIEQLNEAQLNTVWGGLIEQHEMLRTVICSDGTQHILKEKPEYKIKVVDLHQHSPDDLNLALAKIRHTISEGIFPLDEWPFFDLSLSLLPENKGRLHLKIDFLIADAKSIKLLFKQLFEQYEQLEKSNLLLHYLFETMYSL